MTGDATPTVETDLGNVQCVRAADGWQMCIRDRAGRIKNNTRQTAADIAAEIENPLPFAIEPNSPDPQVLVMHTHATEDYRLSAGLWFAPGDGARSTDCSVNMCAVGRVVADLSLIHI